MPAPESVAIDISDLTLTDPDGQPVTVGTDSGLVVLVLMRHRH